jgi:hypothetical protein
MRNNVVPLHFLGIVRNSFPLLLATAAPLLPPVPWRAGAAAFPEEAICEREMARTFHLGASSTSRTYRIETHQRLHDMNRNHDSNRFLNFVLQVVGREPKTALYQIEENKWLRQITEKQDPRSLFHEVT